MSAVKYVDAGVRCDYPGCTEVRYGSQLGIRDSSVTYIRKTLNRMGWRTGVENTLFESEREIIRGERQDFCPEHAGED